MDCSDNEYVCSVKKESGNGYYRLHSIWRSDGFSINITSKDGSWCGEMTTSAITTMSSQLNMSPDLYLKQCKEALTTHDGLPGMTYMVDNGNFNWKKLVDEDSGIKLIMGYIRLQPTNFVETIQNLVTAVLQCNKKLQRELSDLRKERELQIKMQKELFCKLEEVVKAKESMEIDLYSRFILLLNTKKEKIKELQNMIINNTKDSDIQNPYELDTDSDDDTSIENAPTFSKRKYFQSRAIKNRKIEEENELIKKKSNTGGSESEEIMRDDSILFTPRITCPDSSTSPSNSKRKIETLSTKEELLNYFYG